jgi:hypothetical protein
MLKKVSCDSLRTGSYRADFMDTLLFINNQFQKIQEVEPNHENGNTTTIYYGYVGESVTFSRYAQILIWEEE